MCLDPLRIKPWFYFQTLALLDDEDDINQVVDFFSYEHFYVIYCKFWELDKDHDLFISKDDLAKHNDHGKCACGVRACVCGMRARTTWGSITITVSVRVCACKDDLAKQRSWSVCVCLCVWYICMYACKDALAKHNVIV